MHRKPVSASLKTWRTVCYSVVEIGLGFTFTFIGGCSETLQLGLTLLLCPFYRQTRCRPHIQKIWNMYEYFLFSYVFILIYVIWFNLWAVVFHMLFQVVFAFLILACSVGVSGGTVVPTTLNHNCEWWMCLCLYCLFGFVIVIWLLWQRSLVDWNTAQLKC